MIKQVYVKKNGTVWRLPISTWLGVCKDGARDAGYALPDECVVGEGTEADDGSLMIKIDNWMSVDFKDFLSAYERGDIKPQKSVAEPVVAEAAKPKAKKVRAK